MYMYIKFNFIVWNASLEFVSKIKKIEFLTHRRFPAIILTLQ